MTFRSIRMAALTALVAGLSWSGAAQAYWNLDTAPGNTVTDTASTTTVKMSGFYVSNNATTGKVSGNWTAGTLTQFSGNGQGMYSGTDNGSPYHALDNNQNTEGVLLSFSASTVLTSIGLGYTATTGTAEKACINGSGVVVGTVTGSTNCASGTTKSSSVTVDISVFRWTGTTAPTLAGVNASSMAGWELVGNYGDMISDKTDPYNLVNSQGKTSSWWLITAYNSGFSQTAGESRGTLTNGDDFFKLYSVAGSKCTSTVGSNGVCGGTSVKVPEPATLALTGVALVGMAGLRRRKAKIAA